MSLSDEARVYRSGSSGDKSWRRGVVDSRRSHSVYSAKAEIPGLTATATRGVMTLTINTGDPAIGHVGVVFVGMTELSSVDFSVDEGQHVSKGSEL